MCLKIFPRTSITFLGALIKRRKKHFAPLFVREDKLYFKRMCVCALKEIEPTFLLRKKINGDDKLRTRKKVLDELHIKLHYSCIVKKYTVVL